MEIGIIKDFQGHIKTTIFYVEQIYCFIYIYTRWSTQDGHHWDKMYILWKYNRLPII